MVFVDDGRWTCFDQLASALRRRGYRTVRVTSERSAVSRAMNRLCYDRSAEVDDLREGLTTALVRVGVDAGHVIDIQSSELALNAILPWVRDSALRREVREHLEWRGRMVDKLAMSNRLAADGIQVPTAVDADTVTAEQAATTLGLPLLLKARWGFGGVGVHVVRDEPDLARAADIIASDQPRKWYWETFVPGEIGSYVASYSSRVLQEGTFLTRHVDGSSLGPATSVATIDHEELTRIGRGVVRTVGGRGLASIQCVCAPGGQPLVIDVNLRVWGSALTLGGAGVDFVDGYLESLGAVRAERPPDRTRPGRRLWIFPDAAVAESYLSVRRAVSRAWSDAPALARSTGWRYVPAGILPVVVVVGRRGARWTRRTARDVPWARRAAHRLAGRGEWVSAGRR